VVEASNGTEQIKIDGHVRSNGSTKAIEVSWRV